MQRIVWFPRGSGSQLSVPRLHVPHGALWPHWATVPKKPWTVVLQVASEKTPQSTLLSCEGSRSSVPLQSKSKATLFDAVSKYVGSPGRMAALPSSQSLPPHDFAVAPSPSQSQGFAQPLAPPPLAPPPLVPPG